MGSVWAASGTITAASTTDLGKGNTPRYVVEQEGVGRLMKNETGSSSWSVSNSALTTGSSLFALQTYNAISSIVINGSGTGNGRTFSSLKVGTATNNYAAVTATGEGTMNSGTAGTITITPSSIIAANSYVSITLSGNINITSVELVYASSCAATIPGDITKGDAVEGTITLTAEGEEEENDTWYWQTSEDGTATDKGSGATKQVTAAGTWYLRSYNSESDCWSDAKSVVVESSDFLATPTVTFSDGAYVVGASALNLSSLFSSQNSSAVSFALKVATEDATISTNSFSATKAGSYVVVATQEADEDYRAVEVEATITVTLPATGTATVSYALSGSTTTGTVTGVSTISSLSSSLTLSTLTLDGTKSGYSGAINGCTSTDGLDEDDYVDVQFTVADGYCFTPSSVNVQANPFSATGALKAVAKIMDADIVVASNELACAKSTDNAVTFASGAFTGKKFEGTVHICIYFYGAASDKTFYIKSPLSITGTVAAAPTKYNLSFAKGDEGASGTMSTLKYAAGTVVELPACTFTAPEDKAFAGWVVTKDASEATVTVTDGLFEMPAEAVTATAQWSDSYSITKGTYTHGDFEISPTSSAAGQTITLTATPDDDYEFASWEILKTIGGDDVTASVSLSGSTSPTATFTMPAYGVTINATFAAKRYTITYNANLGTCGTASEKQATAGAAITLPLPTFEGHTFNGWYREKLLIGTNGASYNPTADITLYAKWTDDVEGKLFSYVDGNYGDEFKAFDGIGNDTEKKDGWVTANATGKSKEFTDATTGVSFTVTNGGWDNKSNSISSLIKFINGTTTMSIEIPSGYKATVKILYGSYDTGRKLTIGGTPQAAPAAAFNDSQSNEEIDGDLTEITLYNQSGTLTLGASGGNIYIARVAVVITAATGTITAAGWNTLSSKCALNLSTVTGGSAYYASAADGSTVTLTEVSSGTVPAGEGLMIKGTAGATYTIQTSSAAGTAITGNLLRGTPNGKTVAAEDNAYVFAKQGEYYGFYKMTTGNVPAGKAYLEYPVVEGAPSALRFVVEENNATNLNNIDASEEAVKFIQDGKLYIKRNGVVYDAMGHAIR